MTKRLKDMVFLDTINIRYILCSLYRYKQNMLSNRNTMAAKNIMIYDDYYNIYYIINCK